MPTYVRDAADPKGQTFIDHGGGRLEPVPMTDSIIKRAARAARDRIAEITGDAPIDHYAASEAARAVLRAIREPSEAMVEAAEAIDFIGPGENDSIGEWQAMIDAALEEN